MKRYLIIAGIAAFPAAGLAQHTEIRVETRTEVKDETPPAGHQKKVTTIVTDDGTRVTTIERGENQTKARHSDSKTRNHKEKTIVINDEMVVETRVDEKGKTTTRIEQGGSSDDFITELKENGKGSYELTIPADWKEPVEIKIKTLEGELLLHEKESQDSMKRPATFTVKSDALKKGYVLEIRSESRNIVLNRVND